MPAMTFARLFFASFLLASPAFSAAAGDALGPYNLEDQPATLWQFPKQFDEMSGLALAEDGRLFAHQQKRAVIYLIDWRQGAVSKTFSFGRPPLKGDFEGMAIAGKRFFLVTEKGFLLEGREGFEGEAKLSTEYDTGLKKICKVGGLATHSEAGKLLILCRKAEDKALQGKLTIFSWDLETKQRDEAPFLTIDFGRPEIPEDLRKAEPAGLEVLPGGAGIVVVTTGKRFLIELGFDGTIMDYRALHDKRHKNPEGLAITPGGDIIIADEAGTLQLTAYPQEAGSVDNGQHDDQG